VLYLSDPVGRTQYLHTIGPLVNHEWYQTYLGIALIHLLETSYIAVFFISSFAQISHAGCFSS